MSHTPEPMYTTQKEKVEWLERERERDAAEITALRARVAELEAEVERLKGERDEARTIAANGSGVDFGKLCKWAAHARDLLKPTEPARE